MESEKLRFYSVDVGYGDYLRQFDPKVPHIEYPKHNKFFVGVVFEIGNQKYFAPVSSYRQKDKGVFNIYDGGQIISSIRFNFMFPVIDGVYSLLDIKNDFSGSYKNLLQKEYFYCNQHREEIRQIAASTYSKRIKAKTNPKQKSFYDTIMINFKLLEIQAKKYKKQ